MEVIQRLQQRFAAGDITIHRRRHIAKKSRSVCLPRWRVILASHGEFASCRKCIARWATGSLMLAMIFGIE